MRFSIAAAHAFGQWIDRYPGLTAQRGQDVGRGGAVHPDCNVVNTASADQRRPVVGSRFNHLIRVLNLLAPMQELTAVC